MRRLATVIRSTVIIDLMGKVASLGHGEGRGHADSVREKLKDLRAAA